MSESSTLQVVVDAAPAEAGASRVKNAISSMSSSATSALNSLSSSFDRMQSFLSKSNARLTEFFAAIGAGYVLKSFLDRLIEVNTTFNAFIATMNVVTGSVAKSNAEYQYLLAFSNKIGVSIESVTKQYGRLAASMKSVDETGEMTRHVFEAISMASTVLHLKGHETNLLFMALEQSASKGKVSLEEFQRQLANKLPDAMGLASRSMSMTQAEFRDAVTKGTLNVYEVLIKLSNQIKKEYGESAEYAANQFTGQMYRMQNSVFELYRQIGQSGAMDGLTNVVKTINSKLQNSDIGKSLGNSLGVLFNQIASWIDSITASDIEDFFLGLSGIVQSFTAIMRELVGAFSQTVDGKSDFIGFGETVVKMMLVMTDAAMTFLAVIMQLPLSINVVIQDVNVMLAGLKGIKDWATDGLDAAANNINAAIAERNKALALADTNLAIVLGSDDSPMAKAWKKTDEIFANMRKQKAAMEADRKANKPFDLDKQIDFQNLLRMLGLDKTPPKPNKGVESAYEQERVRLFKTAGVAELEYTNIMEGRLKTEGKNRTELEAKMRFDKDYISMSKAQKAELLSMADAADKATAKRVAAEQFQSDVLSMNKAIYQSEMDLMDIANNRNPVEEKNLRQFEEKLKFDSKYLAMSDQMIATEREKAKAADALAVSVESARKAQAYHNATLMQSLDIQRQIEQLKDGSYVSKYTNESQMKDSFKSGGENQFTSEADQQKMLTDARQRDRDMRARDVAQTITDSRLSLDQLQFELQMQGQREKSIRQSTEARKIELDIKKLSAGATGEELAAYKQLEEFLKVQMNQALDEYYAKQMSITDGMIAGLNRYLDEMQNMNSQASIMVSKMLDGLTNGFANSIGRAVVYSENLGDALKNVTREVGAGLISALVKLGIQWVINNTLGQTLAATSLATTTAMTTAAATASAAAWAPAAALASLASFGANSAPAMAGMTATMTLSESMALMSMAGFKDGGFTGNIGTSDIAGVVHGQEFVMNAQATAANRPLLEAMNRGAVAVSGGGATGAGAGGGVNISIENYGTSKDFEVQRLSEGDIRIIARDEAKSVIRNEAPAVISAEISNPNSSVSKSLSRNTNVQRRR
jgi:tape measure domain-containing protein